MEYIEAITAEKKNPSCIERIGGIYFLYGPLYSQ
jgi:hypothetical protein